MKFAVGDVVLVPMLDPQAQNKKTRPAVIAELLENDECIVVAITSSFDKDKLGHFQVANLPFSHGKPKCRSGLDRPSVADCSWFAFESLENCERIGNLPETLVAAIKQKLFDYQSRPSS
ncbi:MAG: type II toxin-antitoxin system PemK/MazF family toxin [Pirellula sp.]